MLKFAKTALLLQLVIFRESRLCYSQPRSSVTPPPPQDPINELIIQVESVVSCRFQIHLCILACVMSREFTREAVTKFLPAQFP